MPDIGGGFIGGGVLLVAIGAFIRLIGRWDPLGDVPESDELARTAASRFDRQVFRLDAYVRSGRVGRALVRVGVASIVLGCVLVGGAALR